MDFYAYYFLMHFPPVSAPSFQKRRTIHAHSAASTGTQGVATQGEQRKLAGLAMCAVESLTFLQHPQWVSHDAKVHCRLCNT